MTGERVSSLFFLVVSAAFLYGALQMPLGSPMVPGPGFMPLLLGIIMLIIAGGLSFRAFLLNPPSPETIEKGSLLRVLMVVSGLILYSLLLAYIGFTVLTLLFLGVFMRLLGVKNWWTILLVSVAATVVAVLVFDKWLHVPFPKGIWWSW